MYKFLSIVKLHRYAPPSKHLYAAQKNTNMQPRKTSLLQLRRHLYASQKTLICSSEKKHIYAEKNIDMQPCKTSLLHPEAFADCLIILCHLSRSFLHSPLCVNFFAEIRDGFSALCRFVSRAHCRSFTILSFYEKYDHALSIV